MTKKIFLIAGEASGDSLGAKLMASIKKQSKEKVEFFGVGGEKMEKEGLGSLFPIHELSLLGFIEIIPHIPHLLNRISQTVDDVLAVKPDVVITIDAPAFNFRVAKKLKGKGIKLVHYVAPTVWAYKPERAKKIAGIYDHLLVLLPFEPPFFKKEGLSCDFVGHPVFEEKTGGDGRAFRRKNKILVKAPLLCVMPGSRKSEIKRLLPVFSDTMCILHRQLPDLQAVVLATTRFEEELINEFTGWAVPTVVVSDKEQKKNAMAASNVALVKSGSGSLEPASAGVPMVIAYKVNPLSAWLLRRMIRVEYVNLVNLVLEMEAIPEFLQENCVAGKLAEKLKILLENKEEAEKQNELVKKALKKMGKGGRVSPSDKAAKAVLKLILTGT